MPKDPVHTTRRGDALAEDAVTIDTESTEVALDDGIPMYVTDDLSWVEWEFEHHHDKELELLLPDDLADADAQMIDISDVLLSSGSIISRGVDGEGDESRSLASTPTRRAAPSTGEHASVGRGAAERPTRPLASEPLDTSTMQFSLERTRSLLKLMREISTTEALQHIRVLRQGSDEVILQLLAHDGDWMFGVSLGTTLYLGPALTNDPETHQKLKPYIHRSVYKDPTSTSRMASMLQAASNAPRELLLHATTMAMLAGLERLGDQGWVIERSELEFIPPTASPTFTCSEILQQLGDIMRCQMTQTASVDELTEALRSRADAALVLNHLPVQAMWLPQLFGANWASALEMSDTALNMLDSVLEHQEQTHPEEFPIYWTFHSDDSVWCMLLTPNNALMARIQSTYLGWLYGLLKRHQAPVACDA